MSPARILLPALALMIGTTVQAQFGTMGTNNVRYHTVTSGTSSGFEQPTVLVLNDVALMQNAWRKYRIGVPMPAIVDWAKDRIVVVALGKRNTGGYAVRLGGIDRHPSGRARISAIEQVPVPGEMVTQSFTSPFIVLSVERAVGDFELVWSKRTVRNISSVPKGTTILQNGVGGVTIITPLRYGYEFYGGGYECLYERPDEVWLGDALAFRQWNQASFGRTNYVPAKFDWKSERLLAVHLGNRDTAVRIEQVGFERKGNRAILTLAERPATGAQIQNPRAVAPYALIRVTREIRDVEVRWAK